MRARWREWFAALAMLAAAGCGPKADELAPVQGQVHYLGRPISGGTIVFVPDPERGGRGPLALGEIDMDGHFTLQSDGKPGAVVGWHRITVAPPGEMSVDSGLPRHYSDPDTSGLSRQIKSGQANVVDIRLD